MTEDERLAINYHVKQIVLEEVSELIDILTSPTPLSPCDYEPGSPEWDVFKVNTLNKIEDILDMIV